MTRQTEKKSTPYSVEIEAIEDYRRLRSVPIPSNLQLASLRDKQEGYLACLSDMQPRIRTLEEALRGLLRVVDADNAPGDAVVKARAALEQS